MSELDPLVDRFGRVHTYLRVSITDRCNFRCQYCMPETKIVWRPRAELLTLEEILRLVELFARLGTNKLRITGGEPTVRKGWQHLLREAAAVPGIADRLMTTNGTGLHEHAAELRAAGLTGINISLDSLQRDRFTEITRQDRLDEVLRGIDAALEASIPRVKLNVVVMAGVNEDEVLDFVAYAFDRPLQVRFIEFMPFLGNGWKVDRVIGYQEMLSQIEPRYELSPRGGHPSDVAKDFDLVGGAGSIGFITSMTDSFCGGCNRMRITADGLLKTCLFLPGQLSLRDLMRSGADDAELEQAIRATLLTKWEGHPPMDQWRQLDNLTMMEIGG
ncbi:MAG: GTP 3',8-cyclase MoaA [Methanoregulaceae archaeon]|nr:GTP 3',8-cyclase MoaA [Methanoregulaceae archaeon]